ncbi:MAG TPA: DNA polymerase III subunit delta [Candidatus Stackebrandtia faecavium]|nr:DNA polymerase III subunit delta [Candidatus Stackebrandtia faecavium]
MVDLPVVRLVLGDEGLLAERAVNDVITRARQTDPHVQVHRSNGSELTPGELSMLTSATLFGGGSVVVVEDAQDAKKDLATALLSYAANPADGIALVLVHAGGNKGKALADGIRKTGAEVETVAKIKRASDRTRFVMDEFRRLGAKPSTATAEALITATGHDLRELASACSQLVADVGGNVTVDEVHKYYRGRAEVSGFTVADAAVAGNAESALSSLRWALSIGVDPVPMADALATGVRNIAKVVGTRGSGYQLASRLGMAPWQVEKAQQQAKGWSSNGLVAAMETTANLNADVKGGAEDREYALERAVLAIAAARGQ